MNTFNVILQAASGGGMSTLFLMGGLFLIMYFFMIRPQMKKQKELKSFREALEKGAQIVTIGGIHGKVHSIQETTVNIKIEDGTLIKVEKSALITDFAAHQQQSGRK